MALVCSKCRSENADGALACRHCGAPLQASPDWGRSLIPDDDSFDPLSAPTLVMQHTAPATLPPIEETALAEAPAGNAGRRIVLGLAAVVLLAAGGVWLLRPGDATPPVAAPSPVARPASAATVTTAAASAASAPASASAAAPPASVAAAAASAALRQEEAASAIAAAPAASVVTPASAPERRKRIPEPVPRPRAQQVRPAAPPAAQSLPPAAPAAPASMAAPTPERMKTVAELCAGNNLLMRGFCEQRECRKAEFASDATCVKLKETEQRRLFQQ